VGGPVFPVDTPMLNEPRPTDLALEIPELPLQIGKYRVLRKLGEGATSEVFLCHDDFNDRDVAIKRVRVTTDDPVDGRYSERFFNAEAALVGRLQHPNVVKIFDAVVEPGRRLPRHGVRGRQHAAPVCRADQLLSLELIVEIGFKCAMALGYVYRQGLIHRDVKPANLLVRAEQRRDHRREDHRFRQRAEPRLRCHAGLSRRARSPICRPSSSTAGPSTAAPTCTRSAPCSTTSSPGVRPSMRRCSRR
jgi:serine/threonine protein kinase